MTCGRNSRTIRTSGSAASSSFCSAKQPSGSGGGGSPSGRPESVKPRNRWRTPRISRARAISSRRTAVRLARISGRSIALLSMSPRSPPVRVQTMTSAPERTYRAIVAAPLLDSSSGCACTAISRNRAGRCWRFVAPGSSGMTGERPLCQRGRVLSHATRAPGAPARWRRKTILHDNRQPGNVIPTRRGADPSLTRPDSIGRARRLLTDTTHALSLVSLNELRRGAAHGSGGPHRPPCIRGVPVTETRDDHVTWLTQEAYDRLKAELDHLSGPGRVEIAEKIEAARADGDLRENGGYHAAKEEQGKQEARINQIQHILENAKVGEPPRTEGVVGPGMTVTVRFDGDDDEVTFLLASREESGSPIDVYSPRSPLGSAIAGKKVGETATYTMPNGRAATVEILEAVPYGEF